MWSTEEQSDTKDCFLGSAARDLVTLSQPAALKVLLARKMKFLKRKWANNNLQSREKDRQTSSIPIINPGLH